MKKVTRIIVGLYLMAATVLLTISCGGSTNNTTPSSNSSINTEQSSTKKDGNSTNKSNTISNANDWIKYVSSTNDIAEIHKVFCSMSPNHIESIFDELTKQAYYINKDDAQARATYKAFNYMSGLVVGYRTGKLKSNSFAVSESFCENVYSGDFYQLVTNNVLDVCGTEYMEEILNYIVP